MNLADEMDAYTEFSSVPVSRRSVEETQAEQARNLRNAIGQDLWDILERIETKRKIAKP